MRHNTLNRLQCLEANKQVAFPAGGIAYKQADNSWQIHFNQETLCCTNAEKAILETRADVHLISYECS